MGRTDRSNTVPFELTDAERACPDIRYDGERITIRPTARARKQLVGLVGWAILCTVVAIVGAVVGIWFLVAFYAICFVPYAVMLWRMAVARVVVDRDGLRVHNMWSYKRLRGADVAFLTSNQQRKSSLWTYGLDARWPFSWATIDVGRIVRRDGLIIEPEAFRSDVEEPRAFQAFRSDVDGPRSVALLKLSLVGRWRAAYWLSANDS